MDLSKIKGVGEVTLENLNKNGIYTLDDLIHCYPKEYIVYEPDLERFLKGDTCYIEGVVSSKVSMYRFKGKSYAFSFYIDYEGRNVKISLFTALFVGVKIKTGMRIGVYGKYNLKEKYFSVRKLFDKNLGFKIENNYCIKDLTDNQMGKIIKNALPLIGKFNETLPDEILNKYKLLRINEYIIKSHFPVTKNDIKEVLRRRKYEEFFWYSINFDLIRNKRIKSRKEKRIIDVKILDEFKKNLNFELTIDQNKALNDCILDLNKPYAMNRLIQGDVGCGKTIVAIMMSLLMVKAGYQVAVMVPTEVLANQHFISFKDSLIKYGVNIELLTGSLKRKDRDNILYRLINNRINIIIGTHALISDDVLFSHLGLVIIDEQHRFGVNQRIKLIDKYKDVDSLFLSATPIPRTLGLTLFKDLDMSSIETMPNGRKPVVTKVVDQSRIKSLFKSIENHLLVGEQAYIVVPLVNENEEYDFIDIKTCEEMVNEYLPGVSYEIVHGRMKAKDKDLALANFKNGKVKILISTTVIEVGINVPNATMMIILNSDRFGLATLHQLRGRVGRGSLESYCMLVTNNIENERLQALEKYSSGFDVSEMDFRLRGPGDYLGEDQSGFAGLEYSDFEQDIKILVCAKDDSILYLPRFISGEFKSTEFNKIINKSANELDKIN